MILAIAATEMEMKPLAGVIQAKGTQVETLVSGVGILETCLHLTRYLSAHPNQIDMLFNFGIGGAYLKPGREKQPKILDICLAEREVLGDLGICYGQRMEPLALDLGGGTCYPMSFERSYPVALEAAGITCHCGNFITVNGVSGTEGRGEELRRQFDGLCENMEGAAVARVGLEFGIPSVELRAISNMVEDRNPSAWRIPEAIERAGEAASLLIETMV